MAATLSDSAILDALRPIVDPDFGKSIVDLGFVKNVHIDGSDVSFTIELTTPACPVKAEFEKAARERVVALFPTGSALGARSAAIPNPTGLTDARPRAAWQITQDPDGRAALNSDHGHHA